MSDRREESSEPRQTAVKDVNVSGNFSVGNITQIGQIGTFIQQALLPDQVQQEVEARQTLLKAVRNEVESLIRQSLYKTKQIDLPKELQSRQVESRIAQRIMRTRPERQPLPSEKKMIEIFDEASQKLLILGVPGAGKTIALLELASELLDRTEAQLNEPNAPRERIPILLNLATWKANHQAIDYWIVEEMKSKYGVRRDLGRRWLNQRQLLPLLDELDRLSTEHQEVCIAAINDLFQQEHQPHGLVVCSRLDEYQSHSIKLKLEEAICLKPLTESQICEYLSNSIKHPGLWNSMQEDSDLLEIVRSPLFLSILVWTVAPQESSTDEWQLAIEKWQQCKSIQERRDYFFEAFIEQMLNRDFTSQHYPKGKEPSSDETQHYLIQLAKVVKEKSPTEFLIENIQPNWWLSETEESAYSLIVRLVVGLTAGFTAGLYLGGWTHKLVVLFFAMLAGVVTGVLSHFFALILEKFPGFFSKLLSKILPGLIFSLLTYILSSLILRDMNEWSFLFLLTGIGVGSVFHGLSPQHIKAADKVEFSSSRAIRYAGVALILGIIYVPVHFLLDHEVYAVNPAYGLYEVFSFFLVGLLAGAIPGKEAKLDLKKLPNQGIWRTRNYSILWLVIGGLVSGIFTIRMDGFEVIRSTGIALTVALLASLIGGGYSGLVCIQHSILRFILYQQKYIPWNYARFLNYATERTLLQRVGGRYRFWHDFLREHFGEMNLESGKKTSV